MVATPLGKNASLPLHPIHKLWRRTKYWEVKSTENCKNCKVGEQIPQQSKNELAFAFAERMVKRLWIALCISISLAVAAPLAVHFGWLYYESKFEPIEYSYDYQQDGECANIIGECNDVNNGTTAEREG